MAAVPLPKHRTAVWSTVTALCAAGAWLAWKLADPGPMGLPELAWACVACAPVAAILAWRFEQHSFAVVVAAMGLAVAGAGGLGLALSKAEPWVVPTLVAGGATSLLGVAWYGFLQHLRAGLPNLLPDEYGRDQVLEQAGVQMVFVDWPEALEVGDVGELVLVLQSAVLAERVVGVRFDSSPMPLADRPHFRTAEVDVVLAPGDVTTVHVPLTPSALARGNGHVVPLLQITGKQAPRCRWWRAPLLPLPAPRWRKIAGLLMGELGPALQEGYRLDIRVPAQPDDEREAELPLAHVDTLWTAADGHLVDGGHGAEAADDEEADDLDEAMDGPDPFADADAPLEH